MLRNKIALVVAGLGAASLAFTAAPAQAAHPAYTNNCRPDLAFCNLLAQYAPTQFWVYGTAHNQGLISNTFADPYTHVGENGVWGLMKNEDGTCWNWDAALDQMLTDSCIATDHNEWFWVDQPGGPNYPNGEYAIKSWVVGTGSNLYISNSSGLYIHFLNGNNAGTELSARA